MSRNLLRMSAFDIAAPLAAIAALLAIGVVLGWPLWWVSVCSVLVLLVVEGVVVDFLLLRRNSVSVGTDDGGPRLRLAVVALCTAALVAAVVVGFTHWTMPDRALKRDSAEVVRIATAMAESAATFSPMDPAASIDRAAAMMVPERAEKFKEQFAKSTAPMAQRMITAEAATLSAGVEAIGPSAASVAVVMRGTQSTQDQRSNHAVIAMRVKLTKKSGNWLVLDIAPIHR